MANLVDTTILSESKSAVIDETELGWVKEFKKSWLAIDEKDGALVNTVFAKTSQKYPRVYECDARMVSTTLKRGLVRHMTILLDMSQTMMRTDYKPTRLDFFFTRLVDGFIKGFFKLNPLSSLSIACLKDGDVSFITRMGGQPQSQCSRLSQFITKTTPSGTASLGKGIDVALKSMADSTLHATREVLVLWGSVASIDPPDLVLSNTQFHDRIVKSQTRISILSIEPEIYALRKLSEISSGSFKVSVGGSEFSRLLDSFLSPPPNPFLKPEYIKMGFPLRSHHEHGIVKCACHLRLVDYSFRCPQCQCSVCEIPASCPVCKLFLVDADLLSGVHRHLYSMPEYSLLSEDCSMRVDNTCCGCNVSFSEGGSRCNRCLNVFCYDCDMFSHTLLRHCPGGCLLLSSSSEK